MNYIYYVRRSYYKGDRTTRIGNVYPRIERRIFAFSPVLEHMLDEAKILSSRYKRIYFVSRQEYDECGNAIAVRTIAIFSNGSRLSSFDTPPVASTPHKEFPIDS